MREVDLIHRQIELVAVSIGARVERVHDALESIAFLTRHLLSRATPGADAIERWLREEEFEALESGFFESRRRMRRLENESQLDDEFMFCWRATLRDHAETRRRFFLLRDLAPYLVKLHTELRNVAWIYYQDAETRHACMVLPGQRPEAIIPADFDWHEYHSFLIVRPDKNPERSIRWSPPNVDYGGHGLISCVSIPMYAQDTFLGVWTMDVRLSGLHSDLALENVGSLTEHQTNFIVDYDGVLIAHPSVVSLSNAEKGSVHTLRIDSLGGEFASLSVRDLVARGQGQLELTDAQGERLFVAFRVVPKIEWIVFAAFPTANLVEVQQAAFQRAFARLGSGDLSFRLDAAGDRTMQQLVASYNEMAEALQENMRRRERAEAEKRALSLEQERLGRELEIAATIQLSMLPRTPLHPEFEFAGAMRPAEEVGGDFYDIIPNQASRLWLTIGDVSSHGLGAGLVMMVTQTAFQALFEANAEMPADEVFRRVNRLLHAHTATRLRSNHYVTAQLMAYRGDGSFDCVGAHLWPLIIDPQARTVRRIEITGPWLGVVGELPRVPVSRIQLHPGEVMCLYSDGVIEARNAADEMYDLGRLTHKVLELVCAGRPLAACASDVLADVEAFAPKQDDDRTVLFVRRTPS